ncbi:MAG TPA: TetR/AcrR family transcriptional regulator [Acidimicrobiia bacterium]|nr:TetR/AcrR family transcriptional regulator [Acidimicrobiia bacterium]
MRLTTAAKKPTKTTTMKTKAKRAAPAETTTTVPDRSRRPSADSTRERIVAAAADLFAERSFDGATTREIAARAGVAQPLLNYHYRTKDELWRAAVDSLFESLTSSMAAHAEELRDVDELTGAKLRVREFVTFSARHPQLHCIITQESRADSARMDYLVERHVRPLYESTVALFERLVRDGVVPPIPPAHLYYILTGAGPTMFVLAPECRRLTGFDPESDAVIEAHADAVCALLFGRP